MIEVELHDGRILEFPDGTADAVIDGAVQNELGLVSSAPQKSDIQLSAKDGGGSFTARTAGLGARGVVEGVGDILDMALIANPAVSVVKGLKPFVPGMDKLADKMGNYGERAADFLNLPTPETDNEKLDVAASGESQVNGVVITVDVLTGCAEAIERICEKYVSEEK